MGELKGVTLLVMTSGHEVTDHRVYAKQVRSFLLMGARVTLVGYAEPAARARLERVERLHLLTVPKPSSRLMRFLWQPWRCLWRARRERPDIIHVHDAEMLITFPVARLWWIRAKFVYDVHEDFANLMLIRDWIGRWSKPLVRLLTDGIEKTLASLADAIVGVTPPLTDKFKNRRRIVAYNYPAGTFFQAAGEWWQTPAKREFDVVHLGTLSARRAEFLAETLRELQARRPAARSLVVGVSERIATVLAPRVPEGCLVLGKTSYDDIPRLLSNAKVGVDVHPWRDPHLDVALPVKVCEYMAAGCAVVSSAMPVLKQVLDEAGVDGASVSVLEGGAPSDYAEALERLLEVIDVGGDPGADLRRRARASMVWEREADRICALYRSLLDKPCVS
ncbi:glycosyltransferase [Candidatus Nitrospira bockiana]